VVRIRKFACFMAFFACSVFPAFAAEENVYVVRKVEVDASAESAAKAKEIALNQAQGLAFQRLMRRLTLQEDWARLPQMSAGDLTPIIVGIEVEEEKNSATRYLGKIAVAFRPNRVRDVLTYNGIPYSETRAKPVVILPILQNEGATLLWEEENTWSQAWRDSGFEQELVPVVVPLGDLQDAQAVNATDAMTADWGQLAPIVARYDARAVLIASAQTGGAGGSDAVIEVKTIEPNNSTQYQTTFKDVSHEAVLSGAVSSIGGQLQQNWKRQTIVQSGAENWLNASITFKSFNEWLGIRRKLAGVPSVRELQVVALSVDGAQVTLKVLGTASNLGLALAQSDLELVAERSQWIIRTAQKGANLEDPGNYTLPLIETARGEVPGLTAPTGNTATGSVGRQRERDSYESEYDSW